MLRTMCQKEGWQIVYLCFGILEALLFTFKTFCVKCVICATNNIEIKEIKISPSTHNSAGHVKMKCGVIVQNILCGFILYTGSLKVLLTPQTAVVCF